MFPSKRLHTLLSHLPKHFNPVHRTLLTPQQPFFTNLSRMFNPDGTLIKQSIQHMRCDSPVYWYSIDGLANPDPDAPCNPASPFGEIILIHQNMEVVSPGHQDVLEPHLVILLYTKMGCHREIFDRFKTAGPWLTTVTADNPYQKKPGIYQIIPLSAQERITESISKLVSILEDYSSALPQQVTANIQKFITFPTLKVENNVLKTNFPQQLETFATYPIVDSGNHPKAIVYNPINNGSERQQIQVNQFFGILMLAINNDFKKESENESESFNDLKQLLIKNPQLANLEDSDGCIAHELAFRNGSARIFNLFFEARKKIGPISADDLLVQEHYTRYINGDYSILGKIAEHDKNRKASKTVADSIRYLAAKYNTADHNEPITTGFTEIALAVARNKALINSGTPLTKVIAGPRHNQTCLNLIDQANTPEMMSLLLHHMPTLELADITDKLILTIARGDTAMLEAMLYHLQKLPTEDQQLSIWELILAYNHNEQVIQQMLAIFLRYYALAYGLYLPVIHDFDKQEVVRDFITAYNKKAQAKIKHNASLPKFKQLEETLSGNSCLIEKFITHQEEELTLAQKSITELTYEEKEHMWKIHKQNFAMLEKDDATQQKLKEEFEHELLPYKGDGNTLVCLVYCDNNGNRKLISFITFEQICVQNKIVLHLKLAANDKDYAGLNLLNLITRNALVLAVNHETSVLIFAKLNPPGFALSAFPFLGNFYPKKYMDPEFITNLAKLTENKATSLLSGNGVSFLASSCSLRILREKKADDISQSKVRLGSIQEEFYKTFLGTGPDNGMLICYVVDKSVIESHLKVLTQYYGITPGNFEQYSRQLLQLLQNLNTEKKRSSTKLKSKL